MQKTQTDQLIAEIESLTHWRSLVMDQTVPVILQCHAQWSPKCQKVTQLLQESTLEHNGKFHMVRLNIDNCVELAKGLGVKRVPHTFLLFKGSILESQLGYDPSALKDLVQTALLVDQAENDESVATQVLNQAETLIREDKFEEAMQLLHDLKSWEGWGRTFACEIAAGLAWCQLKTKKDPVLARQAFESVTEAQIADLDEASYWSDLLYQIDSEIEKVKAEAGPDLREYELLGKIDLDHADTGKQWELAQHLRSRERLEQAIPVLLNILAVDRNYQQGEAKKMLMDIFARLGSTNEAVKQGRKQLAMIMF